MPGEMKNDPGEHNSAVIDFQYKGNYETCQGGRKRRLNKEERSKFGELLIKEKQSACRVRYTEAANVMKYRDDEPSTLPTLNALRIIKCRGKQSDTLDPDPILATIRLKQFSPYAAILRDIGYDPFFLHYWSSAQVNAYPVYTQTTKVPRVSIDATGSLVRRINLVSGRKTNAIFSYEIAVHDPRMKLQFPVAHFISERHNNTAITFWLLCWMREDITPPSVCITDQSKALMMACTRAFTQYPTFDKYIEVCSSLLKNEDRYEIPYCMIRNDYAHVIHLISAWPEIKNAHHWSKNFYLRCAALIIASTNINDAKILLTHLFTVLLSEEEGFEDNFEPKPCQTAKQFLLKKIAGEPGCI